MELVADGAPSSILLILKPHITITDYRLQLPNQLPVQFVR